MGSMFGMTLLLLLGGGLFAYTANQRWRLMRTARAPQDRMNAPGERWKGVWKYMFGQLRMFRYKGAGIAHAFIFLGFVILSLRTLILIARAYTGYTEPPGFGFWLFDDDAPLGYAYLFLKDLVSGLVIIGVGYFLWQRLVVKPKRMSLSGEGIFILFMILGLMFADLTYEAGLIVRESAGAGAKFHPEAPLASAWAFLLANLGEPGVVNLMHAGFWLHTVIVLAFLNFLPFGKHFHVLTVLPNVYFRNLRNIGRLEPLKDIEGRIEREETLGVRTTRDLGWKDVLDLYTCTECGRCSDHCPATNTGKLLSPKHLTIALRDQMYENQQALIAAERNGKNGETDSGSSGNGDGEVPASGYGTAGPAAPVIPLVMNPEVIWACTSCGACEQECPVFISYVDKIVGLRQHQVMEAGEFPEQLQTAFRGLESVGNPYSYPNEQRAEWAKGLEVPLRSDKPEAEYLWFVGCAPSFDDRSRKVARAFAQLLNEAGVDYAILGPEETCNGDPARRAGNEYLFQMFAEQNIETMKQYNVRKIITTCPHCFNIFKNEYPDFGGEYEVIHHTDLLWDLVRGGKLKPEHSLAGRIVYHDSCYIGRYNDIYDPPREILKAIPGLEVVEAAESRSRGMCCGAGGAQMWKEEEATSEEKVNHRRAKQLLKVLPNNGEPGKVASACPFCKTMISDALTDQGHDEVQQLDVAEYLLQSVQGPRQEAAATSGAD